MFVLEGKATQGFTCWTFCGLPLLLLAAVVLFASSEPVYGIIAAVLLGGFGILFMCFAMDALRTKRVEIDRLGIRIYYRDTLRYETGLKDLVALSARRVHKVAEGGFGPGCIVYPPCIWRRIIVTIETRENTFALKQDRFISDKEKLKRLFRALRYHLKKNEIDVTIEENLG